MTGDLGEVVHYGADVDGPCPSRTHRSRLIREPSRPDRPGRGARLSTLPTTIAGPVKRGRQLCRLNRRRVMARFAYVGCSAEADDGHHHDRRPPLRRASHLSPRRRYQGYPMARLIKS